jgi:hypothetical protein
MACNIKNRLARAEEENLCMFKDYNNRSIKIGDLVKLINEPVGFGLVIDLLVDSKEACALVPQDQSPYVRVRWLERRWVEDFYEHPCSLVKAGG